MTHPKAPEGARVDSLGAATVAEAKPPPKGYGPRWYPPRGVDACRRCGSRSATFLAHSLKTGKLVSFEESGMPHRAVCPGRRMNPAKRAWWEAGASDD